MTLPRKNVGFASSKKSGTGFPAPLTLRPLGLGKALGNAARPWDSLVTIDRLVPLVVMRLAIHELLRARFPFRSRGRMRREEFMQARMVVNVLPIVDELRVRA